MADLRHKIEIVPSGFWGEPESAPITWFVDVVLESDMGPSTIDCAIHARHGPFASQWEAAQFAAIVTPETPVDAGEDQ